MGSFEKNPDFEKNGKYLLEKITFSKTGRLIDTNHEILHILPNLHVQTGSNHIHLNLPVTTQ